MDFWSWASVVSRIESVRNDEIRRRSQRKKDIMDTINPLTPNDRYSGRTAPLTSKRFILYIYSTNTGTDYFKHGIHSPFFPFKMQFVS